MSNRPHGYARYRLDNCRCAVCKDARRKYDRKQVVLKANGKSATVDAEPIRQHVRTLQAAGIGTRRICEASGVGRTALLKLLNGCGSRGTDPSRRVLASTAEKLLAVQPTLDVLGGKALLDPTGTQRRLRALVALGWSQAKLADQIEWTPANFGQLIHGTYGHVIVETARRVRRLYDELNEQRPPEQTHRDKIAASRARRYAASNGWTPPVSWDDDTIDDPSAHPNMTGYDESVVQALLAGQAAEFEDVDLREAVRRLEPQSLTAIAKQIGIPYNTVYYRVRVRSAA